MEAVRSVKTISELAKQFKVHPNQVTLWKKQLLEGAEQAFKEWLLDLPRVVLLGAQSVSVPSQRRRD